MLYICIISTVINGVYQVSSGASDKTAPCAEGRQPADDDERGPSAGPVQLPLRQRLRS